MSTDPLLHAVDFQIVEATLGRVRAGATSFEELVLAQLEELERLRVLLEQRERMLDAGQVQFSTELSQREEERNRLATERRELAAERESLEEQRRCLQRDAEQIQEHTQRLARSQAELEESRQQFNRLREQEAGETGTASAALLSQLEEAENERARLDQELAAARAQIGRLADVTAELAEVRAELLRQPERLNAESNAQLAALEKELEILNGRHAGQEEELSAARSQIRRLTDATIELAEVRSELAEVRAELLRQPEHTAAAAEAAAQDMCRQLEQLEQQRVQLVQELADARAQAVLLGEAHAELAKVRAELEAARLELVRKPDRSGDEADSAAEEMCRRLADLEQERSTLEQELSASRTQVNRLVDATAELAQVRGELAAARAELLERAQGTDSPPEEQALREQVRGLQRERELLETELETVRRRVVEMAETATAEKQRTTQERAEWSKEFKQLRKLLELQVKPAAVPAEAPREAVPAGAQTGGDPMLEAVMAQFDMLQKDIARRRTGAKKPAK